jgi:hypothetical protein
MIRPATLISFALAIGLGFGLFKVKYAVQGEEQQLVTIEDQIVTDENAIHVLKAEWSQETQPDQLGAMAERHLALAPIKPAQLGTFDMLPPRVAPPPAAPTIAAPPAASAAVAALPAVPHPTLLASAADPRTGEDAAGFDAVVRAIAADAPAIGSARERGTSPP